jgi:predicted Zn finger-like uncharacterized protein
MSLLVSCPQCKQQLKVADNAVGKNVKCPGCAHVFKAAAAASPVAPVAPVEQGKQDSVDVVPTASSPPTQPKKKAKGLRYGCLAGVFVVLLCSGTLAFGVYWMYSKGKAAWNEAWTAATSQPTPTSQPSSQRQSNPPPRDERQADKPANNDQPPPIQKLPEKAPDLAVIEAEIKAAGAGVKLVKLDLAPAGLDLFIDAPEGATAEQGIGQVEISKGDHFFSQYQEGSRSTRGETRQGCSGKDPHPI